jgi:hypothetical protein
MRYGSTTAGMNAHIVSGHQHDTPFMRPHEAGCLTSSPATARSVLLQTSVVIHQAVVVQHQGSPVLFGRNWHDALIGGRPFQPSSRTSPFVSSALPHSRSPSHSPTIFMISYNTTIGLSLRTHQLLGLIRLTTGIRISAHSIRGFLAILLELNPPAIHSVPRVALSLARFLSLLPSALM